MGKTMCFDHEGTTVTIRLPSMDSVKDSDDSCATKGAYRASTGEVIYYHIHNVDVLTECPSEIELPDIVLTKNANAYDEIDKDKQAALDSIITTARASAVSTFEYWISLLRWINGSPSIGREERVGNESGWGTRLYDRETRKVVWLEGMYIEVEGVNEVTTQHWVQVQANAKCQNRPPMHVSLLHDAIHCMHVGDYRRAIVDLSIACEVYLRTTIVMSLPVGVQTQAMRLIEEANINQFVSQLFPELLTDLSKAEYSKRIKDEVTSLFAKRNKLMHMASLSDIDRKRCERYISALKSMFSLNLLNRSC